MQFRNLIEYAKISYGASQMLNIAEGTLYERDRIKSMREAAYRKVLERLDLDGNQISHPQQVYQILSPYGEVLDYFRAQENWQNSLWNSVVFGFSAALILSGISNLTKNYRDDAE